MSTEPSDAETGPGDSNADPSFLPEVIPVHPADSTGQVPIDPEDTRAVFVTDDAEDVPEVLPAPHPPHPNFWWALLWCLGLLFLTQILCPMIGFIAILLWELIQTPDTESMRQILTPGGLQELVQRSWAALVLVVEISVIGFSLFVIRLMVGRNWKRRLALKRPSLSHFILVMVGFPGLYYLAEGIYALAERSLPGVPGMEDALKQFSTWNPLLAVLIIGVGAGVGEELWCRGFLGRGLVGNYGVVTGVLLTSLFFGLIHVHPPQATMAFFMGICLHFVYLTSRSLLLAMFLHFFNNSFSVLLSRLSERFRTLATILQDDSIHPALFMGSIFLVAAVGWAMYVSRVRLVGKRDDLPVWRPNYPGVEYPPCGTGTVVWRPWPGWQASAIVLTGILIFALSIYFSAILEVPK